MTHADGPSVAQSRRVGRIVMSPIFTSADCRGPRDIAPPPGCASTKSGTARFPPHRDRALVALRISTGARASELFGVRCGGVDAGSQLVTVIRKGSRAIQPLPAPPHAFVWLRLYQQQVHGSVTTGADDPLWWTLRKPLRPRRPARLPLRPWRTLAYHAARAMFARANASLGANWSLHDLRHPSNRNSNAPTPAATSINTNWQPDQDRESHSAQTHRWACWACWACEARPSLR